VSGIGEKTAARLIARHGSLDAVLAALDDPDAGFAPGLRAKLAAATAYLAAAPAVVAVARHIAIPPVAFDLPRVPTDPEALLAAAGRWGVAGAARRLVDALAVPHS
jgi:hypothetical protein